jgi:hypothetical protein
MKIIFDATILAEGLHKTSNRSGIFWAALGIFGALDRRADVELGIYSSPSFIDSVNAFLAREFPGRGYKVLNREHSCLLGPLREKIESLRERPENKRGLRKKTLVLCGMFVKIARILWDKYVGCRRTARIADGFDAFFSPVYLAPRPIRRCSRTRRFTFSKSSSVEPYLRFKIRDFIPSGCVLRMRLKVPASAAKSCFVRSAKSSGENGTICGDVVCFAIDMAPPDQFIWADGFCYVGVALAKGALSPGDTVELLDFEFLQK